MTTKRSAAAATIFSRVWAPPPPLTSQPSGATWSAPSIAMSRRSSPSNGSTASPSSRAAVLGRDRGGDATDAQLALGQRGKQVGDRAARAQSDEHAVRRRERRLRAAARRLLGSSFGSALTSASLCATAAVVRIAAMESRPTPRPRSRPSASTRSARCRSMRSRRRTPGTPGRRWRWRPAAYALWQRFLRFDPAAADLAQPRPLRALGRPRLDAAVLDAAPDRRAGRRPRLRGDRPAGDHARGHQVVSPARLEGGGPSRVPLDARASRRRPARSGQGVATSVGMALAGSGRRRTSTGPASSSSTTTST